MIYTNRDIYALNNLFSKMDFHLKDQHLPAKIYYCIEKNKKIFHAIHNEIEQTRLYIARYYGNIDEETGVVSINEPYLSKATQELDDLFNVTQEIELLYISLLSLRNYFFTFEEMSVLEIMINDDVIKEQQYMHFTNSQVYEIALLFQQAFKDFAQYLPAEIGFYIQKNKSLIFKQAQKLEMQRINIINNYQKDKGTTLSEAQIQEINEELQKILNEEVDIPIVKINLSDLQGVSFTPLQMEVLLFMIDENQGVKGANNYENDK